MRLRHIEVFFSIWRNGSITAAAEELAISQSSVSKTLKHAEQNLGFELFHRVRGKLVLTEEGEILLLDAERIHDSLERMRRRAKGLKNGIERSIRIVCLPSLGMWLIPQALVEFRRRHAGVALEVSTKHEGEMLDGLRSRQFDLAFGFDTADPHPPLPGLTSMKVAEGEMVYIERGPGGWGPPIGIADIDYDRLIGLNGQHFLGNTLRRTLREAGMPDQPATLVQTYYIARAMTANGAGCSIVDEFTAITDPQSVTIRPLEPRLRFGLYMHYREDRVLSRHEAALVEAVTAVASAPRGRGRSPDQITAATAAARSGT